jgi:hypothetical protein
VVVCLRGLKVTLDFVLEELPLEACRAFWHPKGNRIASYEKFKILSVIGGAPHYLEQINPNLPAETNIQNLCFAKGRILVREFDEIFSRVKARHKEIILWIRGLQFENLVVHNRKTLWRLLGIP